MSFRRIVSCTAVCVSLSAALTGCSSLSPSTPVNAVNVTGNWQFSSTATTASRLSSISGELTGSTAMFTGILHADSATACVSPTTAIEVSGTSTAANGVTAVTLNGPLAGGQITITGTLAADGKSLSNATYNVTGGTCAFTASAQANGQSFSSITGSYTGSFSDPDGHVLSITASLTQTPQSDSDGNFQLSGTATFPSNPCFNSPVTVSNSQVTGGSFTLTYADPTTLNSVTASGTFSTDGKTLTVTAWNLTGSCGPDSGTGLLTQQ